MSEHQKLVEEAYRRHFRGLAWDTDPVEVCARAGRAYAEIDELNRRHGFTAGTDFDSTLVWYMAEWMGRSVRNRFVQELGQEALAREISAQILRYYRVLDARRRAEAQAAPAADPGASVLDRLGQLEAETLRLRERLEAENQQLRARLSG